MEDNVRSIQTGHVSRNKTIVYKNNAYCYTNNMYMDNNNNMKYKTEQENGNDVTVIDDVMTS